VYRRSGDKITIEVADNIKVGDEIYVDYSSSGKREANGWEGCACCPPQAADATTATASGVTLTQAQVYINSVLKCTFDIIYT
jgi:DUF1680 family protein